MDNPETQAILGMTHMTKINKTQKHNTTHKTKKMNNTDPTKKPRRIDEKRFNMKSVCIELQTKC